MLSLSSTTVLACISLAVTTCASNLPLVPYSRAEVQQAADCCQNLQRNLSAKVAFPNTPDFAKQLATYYSATEQAMRASCRVSPSSAQDVSTAIKILTQGNCRFSVRSGGHMVWAGAANIDAPGVAIDLGSLSATKLSGDKTIASVGPGAGWGSVYDALDPYNLTVVGGRSNSVGVGGFTLGAGISNQSPRHGFASDNVVNYEVVLADGQIVNANKSSNADLFFALKGGSTNFGIITRYDLATYGSGPMWGGFRGYPTSQLGPILDSMQKFMKKLKDDPSGGAAANIGTLNGQETLFLDFAYLGADGSKADLNSDMLAVPGAIFDTLRPNVNQQNLSEEIDSAFPPGSRTQWATMTIKANTQLPIDIANRAREAYAAILAKNPSFSWSVNFQTFAVPMLEKIAASPNPYGLNSDGGDILLVNFNNYWTDVADDAAVDTAVRSVLKYAIDTAKERGLYVPWTYLNYALPDQPIFESYGAVNLAKLKSIQRKYDPKNVLGRLWKGGFKL